MFSKKIISLACALCLCNTYPIAADSNSFANLDSTALTIERNNESSISNIDITNSSRSTYSTPQSISVNKDYYMNIKPNSNTNFFVQFTIPSDGFIHLKFKELKDSSGKIGNWYVDVLDSSSKNLVDGATDLEPNSKDDYHHYVVGVKKGTYKANIKSRFVVNSGNWSLPFRVNFTATSNFEKESNDTRSTANSIKTNTLYTGIAQEGRYLKNEHDWYKFYLNSKSDINFKINVPNQSKFADFDLYNSNGELVDFVNQNDDMDLQRGTYSYSFNDLNSGTYYLDIHGYDKKVPYQFTLDATPRNSKPSSSLTKDIYRYDAGKGKYLTYINGKGYSQYSYVNKAGTYAFTPSSWMIAAGLHVSMPDSGNNYKMNIENAYKIRYEYAQKVLAEAKKGNITPFQISEALDSIENYSINDCTTNELSQKSSYTKSLTNDIYKYNAGNGKYLTYINGKGYSQYSYLNKSGKYAFTPSSWMRAAGLTVTMPTSSNGYKMTINNPYIAKYNDVIKQIKSYL